MKTNWFNILKDALSLLVSQPRLFLPKFISVTIYVIPYLILVMEFQKVLSNPYSSMAEAVPILLITLLILLLSPVWIFLDALYPPLVKQLKDGEGLSMRRAASAVASRFVHLLIFLLVSGFVVFVVALPFMLLASYGLVYGLVPYVYVGFGCIALLLLLASAIFYFVPSSILLEKGGFLETFLSGVKLAKKNFDITFFLSTLSFLFLLLAFLLEGTFQTLGMVGFVAGRYLGGLIAVYLYVVNPDAYLSMR